jgi:GNAT superfamily N-acetyltransferase
MKTFRQFIKESDDLYKHKLEGLKDIHGDVHVRHRTDEYGRSIYTVHHQGNRIASAKLSGQDHYVSDVDVQKEFRRKGVATKLYDFIEKHSGKPLKPSPMHQTPDGKALWKKRQS